MIRPNYLFRLMMLFVLTGLSFSMTAQRYQSTISSFLLKEKSKLQLTDADIEDWVISDQYDNTKAALTYTYINQQVNGIRIFNAVSTIVIRDGNVLHFANKFYPDAFRKTNNITPRLSADEAIQNVASYLDLTMRETPRLIGEDINRKRYTYTRAGLSQEEITAELVFVPVNDELHLAWNVNMAPVGSTDWWNIRIDAENGQFIEKNNWTTYCSFGHPGHENCHATLKSGDSKLLQTNLLPVGVDTGIYNVYPLPLEAPSFGNREVVKSPHWEASSPFGWHDTDGVEGPEYTITRGNNVFTYEDIAASNQPGYSPDGGTELNFDFPINLNLPPVENLDPILTNLFYTNNVVHDILAIYGFDEASGNFQATNYSGQGIGDDYVLAEGQDAADINNANFATPEDGKNGRMQMFLWVNDIDLKTTMEVHTPAGIAGIYLAESAAFGPDLQVPLTGLVALIDDGVDPITNGCESIVNASEIAGKIAVIDRPGCSYIKKVNYAEAAGAIGVIIVNNVATPPIVMSGLGTSGIPAVMIYQADGELLKASLQAGEEVEVTLAVGLLDAGQDRDASLDNGIILHEFGHGVSNRLTGGPSNTGCLSNREQGGEGWSDWLGLMLTIAPGDTGTDARPIGTYATADEIGEGIRRYPYSTDFTINSQTYGDLRGNPNVHPIGEIWCSTLWDMTWKLIDLEGFDPNWYEGNGGNQIAMRLVLEGMKLQGCRPGYLDARDAILAADEILFDTTYRCLIWEAFAGRGMGKYAEQGSPDQVGDEVEDFSIPNTCLVATMPPTALFAVDATTNCFGKFTFIDMSTDIPQYYFWDFGDGQTSLEENPYHAYEVKGNYTVQLIVTNNIGADTFSMDVFYEDLPKPGVSGNLAVCEGSQTILYADIVDGSSAIWSIGDSVVFVGTPFETPVLDEGVMYSLRQGQDVSIRSVGPADNSFAGGGIHSSGFEGRLLFETQAPLRLISVLMYAQGDGERTIRLYDESGMLVEELNVMLDNGNNRVTLDFEIPIPGKYSLANTSQNLYRNDTGANYPYAIDGLVSIYSSNATSDALAYYYYFYDWKVQEISCVSDTTEVLVDVQPGPLAGYLADIVNLSVDFTDISSGMVTEWSWDFGDGSPVSTEQNPNHVFSEEGVYEVVLTVSNGICYSTYQQMIEVGAMTGSIELNQLPGLRIYPNPASDEVTVEFMESFAGPMKLRISNAAGSLVNTQSILSGTKKFSVNTSALPAGTYQFQVAGEEGLTVRRVSIVR